MGVLGSAVTVYFSFVGLTNEMEPGRGLSSCRVL